MKTDIIHLQSIHAPSYNLGFLHGQAQAATNSVIPVQRPNIQPNFTFKPIERDGKEFSTAGRIPLGEDVLTQPVTQTSNPTPVQQQQINNIQAAQNGTLRIQPTKAPLRISV